MDNKTKENDTWWLGNGYIAYDRHQQLEVLFDRAYHEELPKDPEEYWDIVSQVWTRTEFPHHQIDAWETIFETNPGPNKYTQDWLKNPQPLYRGFGKIYENVDCDWSWTTDKEKAIWFANRLKAITGEPVVQTTQDYSRVMYVCPNNYESEVLLWSNKASRILDCGGVDEYLDMWGLPKLQEVA